MRINLEAKDRYEEIVLNHLEENASDVLVEKINAGNKSMAGCLDYVKSQAKERAMNGVAMVEDIEVFGWAIHYFEEDSIKEGEKVVVQKAPAAEPKRTEPVKKAEPVKKQEDTQQISLFDLMGD